MGSDSLKVIPQVGRTLYVVLLTSDLKTVVSLDWSRRGHPQSDEGGRELAVPVLLDLKTGRKLERFYQTARYLNPGSVSPVSMEAVVTS